MECRTCCAITTDEPCPLLLRQSKWAGHIVLLAGGWLQPADLHDLLSSRSLQPSRGVLRLLVDALRWSLHPSSWHAAQEPGGSSCDTGDLFSRHGKSVSALTGSEVRHWAGHAYTSGRKLNPDGPRTRSNPQI